MLKMAHIPKHVKTILLLYQAQYSRFLYIFNVNITLPEVNKQSTKNDNRIYGELSPYFIYILITLKDIGRSLTVT